MTDRNLVLASTSPYRRQLLERLRLPFDALSPDCDETAHAGESPAELVVRLAEDKARSVASTAPDALIIGSDQVASLDGRILTKPGRHQRATEQLQACSGRRIRFYTGLCVLDTATDEAETVLEGYDVVFRSLTADEIERYLQAEAPYDCAGSIRSEGYAVTLFERMVGDDPTTLIGLPLIRLAAILRAQGLTLP